MTKKEALAEFKENIMPVIRERYEQDGVPDGPARCEAWNNFTDALQKDGRITRYQCDNWTNPF